MHNGVRLPCAAPPPARPPRRIPAIQGHGARPALIFPGPIAAKSLHSTCLRLLENEHVAGQGRRQPHTRSPTVMPVRQYILVWSTTDHTSAHWGIQCCGSNTH
jgi:hypothetical protein